MPRPLLLDTLVDLTPLAPKPGATQDVPDALQGPLLDNLGTEDGQTKLYAVIDAAQVTGLQDMLEDQQISAKCLYTGDALERHSELAPWLVELNPGDRLLRGLMTAAPTPEADAGWHLWRNQVGIFIRSAQPLEALWRHFRRYTRIQEEGGGTFLFRFFEPDFLAPMLMQAEPGEIAGFFAPLDKIIAIEQRQPEIWAASILSASEITEPPRPMVLTRRKYRALKLVEFNRTAQRICRTHGLPPEQHRAFIDTAVRLQDSSYFYERHLLEAFALLRRMPFDRHAEFWRVATTEKYSLPFILHQFEEQYGLQRKAS